MKRTLHRRDGVSEACRVLVEESNDHCISLYESGDGHVVMVARAHGCEMPERLRQFFKANNSPPPTCGEEV